MPSEEGQAGAGLSRSHDKHDASALSLIPFAVIRVSSPLKVVSMSISSAVGATLSGGVGINTPSPVTFQRQCCSAHLLALCWRGVWGRSCHSHFEMFDSHPGITFARRRRHWQASLGPILNAENTADTRPRLGPRTWLIRNIVEEPSDSWTHGYRGHVMGNSKCKNQKSLLDLYMKKLLTLTKIFTWKNLI